MAGIFDPVNQALNMFRRLFLSRRENLIDSPKPRLVSRDHFNRGLKLANGFVENHARGFRSRSKLQNARLRFAYNLINLILQRLETALGPQFLPVGSGLREQGFAGGDWKDRRSESQPLRCIVL